MNKRVEGIFSAVVHESLTVIEHKGCSEEGKEALRELSEVQADLWIFGKVKMKY